MTTADWRNELKGAFAFESAPFAVHPSDARRALSAIANAVCSGASKFDLENQIIIYLQGRNCPIEYINYQFRLFRQFFSRQYTQIRNCWVLSKSENDRNVFVAIFSGRKSIDDILWHSMYIYQSREFNQATQLMRAKKRVWPNFRIQFHEFESGALWEGRAFIGENPAYILEKANATLSKGLDPNSSVVWRPKPIPRDPGETWHGLRYTG